MPQLAFQNLRSLALGKLLRKYREDLDLSLREVIEQCPRWLGLSITQLHYIEKGTRKATFIEVRELSPIYKTTVPEIDKALDATIAAEMQLAHGPRVGRPRRRKPAKKR